jgi:hypothetical protein
LIWLVRELKPLPVIWDVTVKALGNSLGYQWIDPVGVARRHYQNHIARLQVITKQLGGLLETAGKSDLSMIHDTCHVLSRKSVIRERLTGRIDIGD